jgi:hypothetical protein
LEVFMSRPLASRILVATSMVLSLGIGCGSTGGGGCGGLKPLPQDPAPLGFPSDQVIEGGMQARVTKPGMDKLMATIPSLIGSSLASGFCVPEQSQGLVVGTAYECSQACGGGTGCPVQVILTSADGKDRIVVTLEDGDSTTGNPPIVDVDATLDLHVPIQVDFDPIIGGRFTVCTLDTHSDHYVDTNADPIHILARIELNTDPTTGELTLHLAQSNGLKIANLGISFSDCGLLSSILSAVEGAVNGVITSFIGDFIINLLRPQIDSLLQSFLPKPLGLAGVIDAGSLLAKFSPPKDTNLEAFVVPGGYVKSSVGGLTLGVMSGLNSDRDESTRTPGLTSEPSLCVPARPTPDLAASPWMLPFNSPRKDFMLSPAGPFAGNPDPTDMTGMLKDVAIGVSRTFLDLAGFHIYNSGTLCLSIGGSVLPQLTGGTVSVLVGSLGNILEDRKAPLALVLRPQMPLTFTVGAGDMNDPLLHVAISDMRIDFYGWIEERYVRLLTLGVDVNLGLNLTVTQTADGKPAIQPTLVGLDAKNVVIRVTNTDLLQESPKSLAALFPTLINIATGAIGGVIQPIALPSVAGFSLDGLSISRVQTTQDDFLGIFATIVAGTTTKTKVGGGLSTHAKVAALDVPSEAALQALFVDGASPLLFDEKSRPRVTLDLGADHANGQPVEWAWRVDGGFWRPWTQNAHPVIADDAFLLQGRHTIEVRSRVVNQWATEDMQRSKIEVLVDSVPPELHPARDTEDSTRLSFGGFDIVSDSQALTYAYVDADGQKTAFSSVDGMPLALAKELTDGGAKLLHLYAKDEAGNVGELQADLGPIFDFHGRTTNPPSAGCGSCALGGATRDSGPWSTLVVALGLAFALLRRRARVIGALVLVGAVVVVAGSGCDGNALQCKIDDDCAKMSCAAGQVSQCLQNMCACGPDVGPGDVGRFSSMALIGQDAYVAAYNTTYGDLMIGHVTPPGVVPSWDFVDGVPDEGPTNSNNVTNSHVRGGIDDKGDDVGRYTSIGVSQTNEPVIAYYDKTHGALKFASFGLVRWRSHVVDQGAGSPASGGDDVGRWASMSIGTDGKPMIVYTATVQTGTMSGMPEGQLRLAQAKVPNPDASGDWTVTILDARPLPDASGGADGGVPDGGSSGSMTDPLLPEGIGLMPALARKSDGSPGVAYYDRTRGNLRYIELLSQTGSWSAPVILDGEDAMGNDTADVGMYPSLTYDDKNVGHISYVDATHDNLLYINTGTKLPEVVDDGYRSADENTLDGLDSPVYHLVGDSSSIQIQSGVLVIAYQDSTVEQLRMAQKGKDGKWMLATVAGHATPFNGSYGFYANLRVSNGKGVISSYAINQQLDNPLFYVEVFAVDLGLIM